MMPTNTTNGGWGSLKSMAIGREIVPGKGPTRLATNLMHGNGRKVQVNMGCYHPFFIGVDKYLGGIVMV